MSWRQTIEWQIDDSIEAEEEYRINMPEAFWTQFLADRKAVIEAAEAGDINKLIRFTSIHASEIGMLEGRFGWRRHDSISDKSRADAASSEIDAIAIQDEWDRSRGSIRDTGKATGFSRSKVQRVLAEYHCKIESIQKEFELREPQFDGWTDDEIVKKLVQVTRYEKRIVQRALQNCRKEE